MTVKGDHVQVFGFGVHYTHPELNPQSRGVQYPPIGWEVDQGDRRRLTARGGLVGTPRDEFTSSGPSPEDVTGRGDREHRIARDELPVATKASSNEGGG